MVNKLLDAVANLENGVKEAHKAVMEVVKEKHTPLPWTIFGDNYHPDFGPYYTIHQEVVYPSKAEWEANAKFITKACNSHYELLEALKKLYDICITDSDVSQRDLKKVFWPYIMKADEAITKAEAL